MKKLTITSILAIVFACLIFQACSSAESSSPKPETQAPIPVVLFPLQQQDVRQPIIASGQFSTDDETTLSFKTGGVISQVLVKEGDFVKKGQVLARLDLTEINAQVSQAEQAYKKAERDFIRTKNLYYDSVATQEQYENAQTALALADQQFAAARFNQSFSEIRAVADGYILKKYANAGQLAGPGAEILRTNGAGSSEWTFRTSVSDKEWARVLVGDSASIVTDAAPDHVLTARIVRKSEGADPHSGAFNLELMVDKGDNQQLASGLFGTVSIFPSRTSRCWTIPHEALLDGNANKGWVFVTSDRKTAHRIPVTIASLDSDWVYISEGLEDATSLITQGSAYLSDSSFISIQP